MFVGFGNFRRLNVKAGKLLLPLHAFYPCLSFGKYLISVMSALKEIIICRVFLGFGNFGKRQKQQQSETSVSVYLSFLKKDFGHNFCLLSKKYVYFFRRFL